MPAVAFLKFGKPESRIDQKRNATLGCTTQRRLEYRTVRDPVVVIRNDDRVGALARGGKSIGDRGAKLSSDCEPVGVIDSNHLLSRCVVLAREHSDLRRCLNIRTLDQVITNNIR